MCGGLWRVVCVAACGGLWRVVCVVAAPVWWGGGGGGGCARAAALPWPCSSQPPASPCWTRQHRHTTQPRPLPCAHTPLQEPNIRYLALEVLARLAVLPEILAVMRERQGLGRLAGRMELAGWQAGWLAGCLAAWLPAWLEAGCWSARRVAGDIVGCAGCLAAWLHTTTTSPTILLHRHLTTLAQATTRAR